MATTTPYYITTSLLPSGNRLVTDAFCPVLARSLQKGVEIETTEEIFGVDLGVQWIVGSPSHDDEEETQTQTQFWLLMENGDQYALGFGDREWRSTSTSEEWISATSAVRPLVLIAHDTDTTEANDDTNATAYSYIPLEQPSITSPLSSAVPTPDGGFLLVERLTSSEYQLTQLSINQTDVTHESLTNAAIIQNPLPDSMISFSTEQNLWALYTGATDVYDHAVLGDPLEGGALTVLQWNAETQLVEFHSQKTLEGEPQSGTVFEGLGPIWADVNGDGKEDLVTTISNSAVGARLRVYSLTEGNDELVMLAQAPAINLGGRWLHQLAVGPLGPNGETEIVEIRTPHIGGIVRYYQFDEEAPTDDNLKLVASTSRYTSHDIGNRNLDRAVVGDFNGDGIPELVVQNQVKDQLVALQRATIDAGIATAWSIPLPSPVESNLAVSCSAETGVMELFFATRSHQLVKVQFVPTDTEVDPGIPHDDDGQENQPLDDSSDTTSEEITSGGYMRVWSPLGHSHQAVLCIGMYTYLLLPTQLLGVF